MGVIRQEFLAQTISSLETLKEEFLNNSKSPLSEDFLRRFFRNLHTIKGTSNTFNLNKLATLSHEIENLLQAVQNNQILLDNKLTSLFQESFENLLNIAKDYQINEEGNISQEFIKKLREIIPDSSNLPKENNLDRFIPSNLTKNLSSQEKSALFSAIENNKSFYLLKMDFNLVTFYEDFKKSKQILNDNGEVIAVSPTTSKNPAMEISFHLFFVSNLIKDKIENLVDSISVVFETKKSVEQTDDLNSIIKQIITEAEKNAQILNKKILFETVSDEIDLSNENLLLVSKIVSHLINNAIVHAVETVEERLANGKNQVAIIKIKVSNNENQILLQIEDDGKGIDFKRIAEQAKQQNLINPNKVVDEKQALELIFSSGFSTSQKVSEISGRGVGLDAVKNLVDEANGKIEVNTKSGIGTTFSVYLPQSKKGKGKREKGKLGIDN